jgi:predicted dehydrogenase
MAAIERSLRVGLYGTGSWANRTHLPNLAGMAGVEVVAACDADPAALQETAARFSIPRTYADGHEMLRHESLDMLFSVVPAFARADVEAAAARSGVHLFSEKPQATTMAVARRIDEAVRQGGVISTVCFRERYRPLFQEARRLLSGRQIVHVRFQSFGGLPLRADEVPPERRDSWHYRMDQAGGTAFDWGVHAVDYARYMTGLDIAQAQAFYHHPAEFVSPLSCSFNLRFTTGATLSLSFTSAAGAPRGGEPPFTVFYAGGYLALWMYDRLEVNGEVAYRADEFDPWMAQDRAFVEAVRTGDRSGILNDYHDGLKSLAPVLAGWESARRGGEMIDVAAFSQA